MSGDTVVCRSDDQVSTTVEGEVVALHVPRHRYYTLNAVGSRIWELIESRRSVSAVTLVLVAEYELDRDAGTASVIRFLERLRSLDLVTEVAP